MPPTDFTTRILALDLSLPMITWMPGSISFSDFLLRQDRHDWVRASRCRSVAKVIGRRRAQTHGGSVMRFP